MSNTPSLQLGSALPLDGRATAAPKLLPAHHLVTHGVIVGMTGSGKTGLVMVTAEEALRAGIPVLAIDVKETCPTSSSPLLPSTRRRSCPSWMRMCRRPKVKSRRTREPRSSSGERAATGNCEDQADDPHSYFGGFDVAKRCAAIGIACILRRRGVVPDRDAARMKSH